LNYYSYNTISLGLLPLPEWQSTSNRMMDSYSLVFDGWTSSEATETKLLGTFRLIRCILKWR